MARCVPVSEGGLVGRPSARVFALRGDWSYRGATYNDAYNTELLKTNSYDLFDASVAWTNQDEDLTVTLLGRNLGDEQYLVSGVYGTAFQSFEGLYDRGRQWQLEVRARF